MAAYLYGRTPRYSLGWKSPYEVFHGNADRVHPTKRVEIQERRHEKNPDGYSSLGGLQTLYLCSLPI
jgi:hypothetical protein